MLRIRNTLAIKMFEACGLKTPAVWTLGRLRGKLLSMDNFFPANKWKEIKSEKLRKLFKRCWKAGIADDKDLIVYDDERAYGNEGFVNLDTGKKEEPMGTKKKKVAKKSVEDTTVIEEPKKKVAKKKVKVAKKKVAKKKVAKKVEKVLKKENKKIAKKEAKKKSRFGHREGSQAFTIDSALSKKPKSLAAIVKEVKMPEPRVRQHLRYLVKDKKVVTVTEKGSYKIK